MQARNPFFRAVGTILFCMAIATHLFSQSYNLTGKVYCGDPGVEPPGSTPIQEVTVKLHGANDSGLPVQLIDQKKTDSNGWYSLTVNTQTYAYDFYIIEEVNKSGYTSMDASSVGGSKLTNDRIEYTYLQLVNGDKSGNKFWDKMNAPDMKVSWKGHVISDGSTTPSSSNGTHFGSINISAGHVNRTYTIQNSGTSALTLGSVTISGSGDFTVPSQPISPVAPGASTTFIVRFNPSASGTRSATINIPNNSSKNPYDFTVRGAGTTTSVSAPEIDVRGNDISIPNGDATPELADGTDMGVCVIGSGPVSVSSAFSIHNVGSDTLLFIGLEFSQTGWPKPGGLYNANVGATYHPATSTPILPGDSVHIVIVFTVYAAGTYISELILLNSDADENPYYFSFQVTGIEEEVQAEFDFGDAPEDAGRGYFYPTTLASNGARHRIVRNGPWLGSVSFNFQKPDAETDGQPDLDAQGDDKTDRCDECSCCGGYLIRGVPHDIQVDVGSGGIVEVWLDIDCDGNWQHPAEQIYSGYLSAGYYKVNVALPNSVEPGVTYLRARISTAGGLTPEGPAEDGEVVDEKITIYEADFGDAPDSYGTRLPGFNYFIIDKDLVMFGNSIDGEPDGQPGPLADGDDTNGISDEDGIKFLTPLVPGQTALVEITCTTKPKFPCHFDGYLDFHADGHFDIYDHLFSFGHFTPSAQTVYIKSFTVPDIPMEGKSTVDGPTYARFRIRGGAWDWGEIEDYRVIIGESAMRDYGDAPLSYGDAWHTPGLVWLGDQTDIPDTETGTQDKPPGLGDDNDGNDDEEGLSISGGALVKHSTNYDIITQKITLAPNAPSSNLYLYFWIDYNQDGDFMDTDELLAGLDLTVLYPSLPKLTTINVNLYMNIPSHAMTGKTFMRIRLYQDYMGMASPTGDGGVGEVSDQEVEIVDEGKTLPPGCIIRGYKWNDLNGNGQWDNLGTPVEPPIENWTIWLDTNQDGKADITTQTNSQGLFEFTGLQDGIYTVGEEPRAGWIQTRPSGSETYTDTVESDKPYSIGILFGNQETVPDTGLGAVKWSQPPLFDLMIDDTTCYQGWNEASVYSQAFLADDWFCHDPRPVTCIRWWGSYAEWDSLFPPPEIPDYFHLGVWTDIPKDTVTGFSHPGKLIQEWFVDGTDIHETTDKSHVHQEYMEKPITCFRYTFYMLQQDWFYQEGDSTVYWLSVEAVYDNIPEAYQWGWLTRPRYFNGDVFRIAQPLSPYTGAVTESGEPVAEYWDLAFELGTDVSQSRYDFGDAPDTGFGTTLARNGAHHLFNAGIYLGALIDTEPDGQPHADAQGDDGNGIADEDGIVFLNDLIPGEMAGLQATASAAGYLNVWIKAESAVSTADKPEHVIQNLKMTAGTQLTEFVVPENIPSGNGLMRFRFCTRPGLWYQGMAVNGEVEDYAVLIGSSAAAGDKGIPAVFDLTQNFPNPFNPSTTIRYDLPEKTRVDLIIYNVKGSRIRTLISGTGEPGTHAVTWDGRDSGGRHAPSGLYFCRIEAKGIQKTIKMLFLK
ncbi:choice-of-anchor D domain-containing protein [bacterium]|nr:choice-of-anchor D domain-containing protein [bacterium]RQV97927.1 MAG: choice-of-anchor D domain-containing protein [bacterium]